MTTMAKLPRRTKLAYGLGTVAFGIKDHGFNTLLMLYYNQVIGLPAAWVGTAILLATLVDGIADPFIGHTSDNLRSRWGRRHPFMYAAALPIAIGYLLVWAPPAAAPEIQFVWLMLTSILVRVAISAYEIPSAALTAEFTNEYDERTSLATYRVLFQAVGLVTMSVLVFKVFLRPTPEQPVGQLNPEGYGDYGLAAAAVMMTAVLLSTWGTHHRIPFLRPPTAGSGHGLRGLIKGLRILFGDRTYSSIVVCMFFFSVGAGMATALAVYIQTYFWHLGADQLAVIAGAAGGGIILGLLLVPLSRRTGKKGMVIGLYSATLVALSVPVLLGLTGLVPRDATVLPLVAMQNLVAIGCIFAALIMSASMIADVADHFELKTGERMEGLMVAALIMINKAVSGVGVFLSGMVLALIDFPEKADPATVDVGVLDSLGTIYIVSIVTLIGISLFALSFHPITRASHARTVEQLRERAAAAAAAKTA